MKHSKTYTIGRKLGSLLIHLFLFGAVLGLGFLLRTYFLDKYDVWIMAAFAMGGLLWAESMLARQSALLLFMVAMGGQQPTARWGWYLGLSFCFLVWLSLTRKPTQPGDDNEDRKMRAECPECRRVVSTFEGRKPERSGAEGPLMRYFYRHTCKNREQRSWMAAPQLGVVLRVEPGLEERAGSTYKN